MTFSFKLRPTNIEPCCVKLTMSQPEPSLTPTGRESVQSPSGLSTLSLQRSERSIPLTYLSSKHRIFSIFVMRIWQSTPMDLSYTQLEEEEEKCHGESLGIISVNLNFTSTPSLLINPSLFPCRNVCCGTRLSDYRRGNFGGDELLFIWTEDHQGAVPLGEEGRLEASSREGDHNIYEL
jgi:hypothetical protein